MGRINVNIYNQDEYHNDPQPCQQSRSKDEISVNKDVIWIPIAIFMSIFLTVGWGSNARYSGGGGSSPVIINNR